MIKQKPKQLCQSSKKVQKKALKSNEKQGKKGERTPISKKSVIAPKQFFKETDHAERRSTSVVKQYKPGDHLFSLQSVTDKIFSDEDDDLPHSPAPLSHSRNIGDFTPSICDDDDGDMNNDDIGEDFALSPLAANSDVDKENNLPIASRNDNPVRAVLPRQSSSSAVTLQSLSDRQADTSTDLPQPSSTDIMSLLQQQRAMLQQVIDEQAAFKSKMTEAETRIIAVENLLKESSSSSSSSSGTPQRTKQRILRDLSVSLKFSKVH